jgi:hypothetical protein
MKEIRNFEKKVWELMAVATEDKDLQRIQELQPIVQNLAKIKKDAEKIQEAIDRLEDRLEHLGAAQAGAASRKSGPVSAPKGPKPVIASKEPAVVTMFEEEAVADISKEPAVVSTSGGSVTWEVTEVEIGQNILSTTQAKKAGLIPTDGSPFVVETSLGQVFKTNELASQDRLREKKKIRQFYEGAGVRSGDRVVWTQIRPNTYRLEKAS